MASAETVDLNAPHAPHANAIEAFTIVLPIIKSEILKSRHHWDNHEPRMYSRASGISDHDLVNFDINVDLVKIRSGNTTYGTVIFGKIRIPAIYDEEGQGFIHVRIHDPPNRASISGHGFIVITYMDNPNDAQGTEDVKFHSIFTDEGRSEDGQIVYWRAIQTADTPLEFFNE